MSTFSSKNPTTKATSQTTQMKNQSTKLGSTQEIYFVGKMKKLQKEKVIIVSALPIMFICSLCKPSKRYIRVNHSTFHQHLRAEHFIKDGRVAKCLICSMTFNNIKTAQKHAELTHKKILTNRKLCKDVCKIIEERADPSNANNRHHRQTMDYSITTCRMFRTHNQMYGLFHMFYKTYPTKTTTGKDTTHQTNRINSKWQNDSSWPTPKMPHW